MAEQRGASLGCAVLDEAMLCEAGHVPARQGFF
jgi:hypothetical protein